MLANTRFLFNCVNVLPKFTSSIVQVRYYRYINYYYKEHFITNKIKLSSGHEMPIFGLATSFINYEEFADSAIKAAIDSGYRYIDTQRGLESERLVGDALKKLYEMCIIERKDLFLSNKIPYTLTSPSSLEADCKKSMDALQTDYLDLYLIEIPYNPKPSRKNPNPKPLPVPENKYLSEFWKVMESLVKKNYVKSIGLSNFNENQIQSIYDQAEIKPSNLQIECNASLQRDKLHEFCDKLKMSFTAFRPEGCPDEFLNDEAAYHKIPIDYNNAVPIMEDTNVKYISGFKEKTPAELLLLFLIQQNMVVIPEAINAKRITENTGVFDEIFMLLPEEFAWIETSCEDTMKALYQSYQNRQ